MTQTRSSFPCRNSAESFDHWLPFHFLHSSDRSSGRRSQALHESGTGGRAWKIFLAYFWPSRRRLSLVWRRSHVRKAGPVWTNKIPLNKAFCLLLLVDPDAIRSAQTEGVGISWMECACQCAPCIFGEPNAWLSNTHDPDLAKSACDPSNRYGAEHCICGRPVITPKNKRDSSILTRAFTLHWED